MILEELMLDLMYHLPSQKKVKEFEVTREMVEKRNVSLTMMRRQDSFQPSAINPQLGFCRLSSFAES